MRWPFPRVTVRLPWRGNPNPIGALNNAPQSQVGGPPVGGFGKPQDGSLAFDGGGYPFQVGTQNGTAPRGAGNGFASRCLDNNGFGVQPNSRPRASVIPRDLDWQKK